MEYPRCMSSVNSAPNPQNVAQEQHARKAALSSFCWCCMSIGTIFLLSMALLPALNFQRSSFSPVLATIWAPWQRWPPLASAPVSSFRRDVYWSLW